MQSEISITLRPFVPDDAPKMVALQARCLEISPDISLLPAGFYHGPKFEGGKKYSLRGRRKRRARGPRDGRSRLHLASTGCLDAVDGRTRRPGHREYGVFARYAA